MKKGKFIPFPQGEIQRKAAVGEPWNGRPLTGYFKGDLLTREIKHFSSKSVKNGDRTFDGLFSVFGVTDDVGDMLHNGVFSKTIKENARRFVHVWQHDWQQPPVATVDDVWEVASDQIPDDVKAWTEGTATGGAMVRRTYLNADFPNWILEGLLRDAIKEMSFAFDTIKWAYDESDEAREQSDWPVRHVYEARLWEFSDVLWGANPATMAIANSEPTATRKAIEQGDITEATVLQVFEFLKTGHFQLSAPLLIENLPLLKTVAQSIFDLNATGQADEGKTAEPDPVSDSLENVPSLEDMYTRLMGMEMDILTLENAR